jgi:hypothetical protein
LELQEKGTIQMLYNKWWKNTGDVCTRQVDNNILTYTAMYVLARRLVSMAQPSQFRVYECSEKIPKFSAGF